MTPYYDDGLTEIWCGDWREVLPRLGVRPDLVLTDPPYGDDRDTDYTRFTGGVAASFSRHAPIAGDDEPFDPAPLLGLAPGVMLFGANRYSERLPCGSWLVWDKRAPGGAKNVMSDAEVAWWNHGRGVYVFAHTWDGFNRASERHTAYHPAQKPVALMRWCLGKSRTRGLVFDPYAGAGPVLVASRQLGRRAIGCEVEEEYCRRAVERLAQGVLPLAAD